MRHILYIMIVCVLFSGCEIVEKTKKKKKVAKKPSLEKVDDLNLAKIILKPAKVDIKASRDPFQPLVQEETKKNKTIVRTRGNQELKRYKFLGVVKINNEYVAYLKSGSTKGTYRKDDKLKDYTITDIGPNKVILSNGDQTITLKRGASK